MKNATKNNIFCTYILHSEASMHEKAKERLNNGQKYACHLIEMTLDETQMFCLRKLLLIYTFYGF